jgi:hypothetical protein
VSPEPLEHDQGRIFFGVPVNALSAPRNVAVYFDPHAAAYSYLVSGIYFSQLP